MVDQSAQIEAPALTRGSPGLRPQLPRRRRSARAPGDIITGSTPYDLQLRLTPTRHDHEFEHVTVVQICRKPAVVEVDARPRTSIHKADALDRRGAARRILQGNTASDRTSQRRPLPRSCARHRSSRLLLGSRDTREHLMSLSRRLCGLVTSRSCVRQRVRRGPRLHIRENRSSESRARGNDSDPQPSCFHPHSIPDRAGSHPDRSPGLTEDTGASLSKITGWRDAPQHPRCASGHPASASRRRS